MWTRKELKTKAKSSFKMNYWKTVLVALLAVGITSGAGALSASNAFSPDNSNDDAIEQTYDGELTATDYEQELIDTYGDPSEPGEPESADELPPMVQEMLDDNASADQHLPLPAPLIAGIVGIVAIIALALAIVVSAFILNPFEVGFARFFTRNLNRSAEVAEVAYGFDHNYREGVRTMFWRDVYTLLWGLLLIIPGIVKSYEYRMIPYLLADDPTMTKDRAFAESKRMMRGNKWRAFVLDLSFIGWHILSGLTLGILSIFYVTPYKSMTDAALYEQLRYGDGNAAPALNEGPVPLTPEL